MSYFGAWLKRVPPFKAAVGLLLLLLTASFSLGAASVNMLKLPASMKESQIRITEVEAVTSRTEEKLDRHIYQDSLATSRIYWVLCLMAEPEENERINPLDCEPGGTK